MLKNRSFQILLVLSIYLASAAHLPDWTHHAFYTFSLLIKDLLLWMLPLSVGLFIAHAIGSFEKKAPLFILTLFLFEAVSNGCSVWYAYGCGHLASNFLPSVEPKLLNETFAPLWRLPSLKPAWWSADKGTLLGIALGIAAAFRFPSLLFYLGRGKALAEKILTRFFSRLIPLFVLGFVARMYKTNLLNQLFSEYAELLLWLLCALLFYISLLFLLGAGSRFFSHVRNLLPAAGVAFSSGCSLSTMPWTIEGTSKNLHDPDLAKAVIPATTNIQQIGDCIANAFLCFLIYRQFHGAAPDLALWLPFSAVFVLARFATAAVLGGAIFIMLPLYESFLHFSPEMIAMILAFNVVLDPLITCSNVVANGALCRVFERCWRKAAPVPDRAA